MKRQLIAGLTLGLAAALIGCGGSATSIVQPRSQMKPDSTGTFTLTLPTSVVRAPHAARRSPRFVDPTGGSMLSITVASGGNAITSCVAVAGDPTQPVTLPLYSAGGTISISEYQGGSVNPCSPAGSVLAQIANVTYSSFAPGSANVDVNGLLSRPLTLAPVVTAIIYSTNGGANYQAASYLSTPIPVSLPAPCGSPSAVTFLSADANYVSVRGSAPLPPSPAPTALPPAQYGDFPPVSFTSITIVGGAGYSVSSGGTIVASIPSPIPSSSASPSSITFTATATDASGSSPVIVPFTLTCP